MSTFDITAFLEEYEKFPCLWQKNCPDFKNRVKRDNAEQMLLPVSGLWNVKLLRRKIRSIRCTYNQEVAKIKKSMGTGSGASNVYRPKLVWFDSAHRFLGQNVENDETDSKLEDFQQAWVTENVSEDSTTGEPSPKKLAVKTFNFKSDEESLAKSPKPRKKAKMPINVKSEENRRIGTPYNISQQSVEQQDETTNNYAKYLADKLNQFDPKTKSILIHKFNDLIFEAEMKLFSSSSP